MMNTQVDHAHYNDLGYNEQGRFNSYWQQIDSILKMNPGKILEVGTGNGFVRFVLQKSGIDVTTLDIDQDLHPDILGSVLSMPIADAAFDTVLCCQVLEHLPYAKFTVALKEIHRVIKKNVVLSLPDLHRVYRFNWQVPGLGEIKFLYKIPRLRPLEWEFNGEHYWNISCKNYPLARIKDDIIQSGFTIRATFCVFEMSWHRFFILEKNG